MDEELVLGGFGVEVEQTKAVLQLHLIVPVGDRQEAVGRVLVDPQVVADIPGGASGGVDPGPVGSGFTAVGLWEGAHDGGVQPGLLTEVQVRDQTVEVGPIHVRRILSGQRGEDTEVLVREQGQLASVSIRTTGVRDDFIPCSKID